MATYAELQAEIERLTKEAEKIKAGERLENLVAVRNAVRSWGFTTDEVFGESKIKVKKPRGVMAPKYSDGHNTWSGKGPKPGWIARALANGKSLDDYLIG